uniref:C2H2-type domain-containing protein n=1 Tax=Cannabis sativa TaxID=3483 RepID=A0A803QKT1_CANSA
MEKDQEQKHVCKFCNKSFLNGKVLGGHMRCHGAKNSTKTEKKLNNIVHTNMEGGERVGYGLRVNPKKSCKISGGSTQETSEQEIICHVCDKGFDSLRALFGHMRHHSGNKRRKMVSCKECGKEFESLRAVTGHMKSHSERNWDGFTSLTESSDNISSALEVKSPNTSKRILNNGTLKKMKKPRLEKTQFCFANYSNYFLDDKKVSGFTEFNFGSASSDDKVVNFDDQSALALVDTAEIEKDTTGFGSLKPSCLSEKKTKFDYSNSGSEMLENSPKKNGCYKCRTCNKIFYSHQALGGHQTIHRTPKNCSTLQIYSRQTVTQFEDFPGIEAIGNSTKTDFNEVSLDLVLEVDNNRVSSMTSFEIKEHKCPICFKIFGSGQALGGHKRAHIVKDTESGPEPINILKHHSICGVSDVLDGVPMTPGNEANTEVDLKSWWLKNGQKHELLIGGLSVKCARVGGVEIPNNKRIEFSLQYIHGIGRTRARKILNDLSIENKLTKDFSEEELIVIRDEVSKYMIEGDLRRFNALAIRRLKEIQCYRGVRHIQGLPCRGQRTKNNCRTLKGKKVAIAGKKKAPR